jgi:zinc transporter, ZIP family
MLVTIAVAVAIARAWPHHASATAREARVEQATLSPGQIVLLVVNGSQEDLRVRQVILSDAFVEFRQTRPTVRPGESERITVTYPWVKGEAYDIKLMTATGATIAYGVEDAAVGTQTA